MATDLLVAGSTTADFTSVTEMTGYNVTQEQLARMYTRYRFASEFCKGKEVLEVACGSGQGLGYLARYAKRVIGGDYDEKIVKCANDYYRGRIEIKRLDAQNLSFDDNSFDVVILYEAIYYLSQPEKFVTEVRRVLRSGGRLIICTANKDWSGFNPSPYSYKYFSANELYSLLKENSFEVELFADCPVNSNSVSDRLISAIKLAAVKLHLIPKTMKGKERFKRLFFGKLAPLPPEITDDITDNMGIKYSPPVPIAHDNSNKQYKVLFALAQAR